MVGPKGTKSDGGLIRQPSEHRWGQRRLDQVLLDNKIIRSMTYRLSGGSAQPNSQPVWFPRPPFWLMLGPPEHQKREQEGPRDPRQPKSGGPLGASAVADQVK